MTIKERQKELDTINSELKEVNKVIAAISKQDVGQYAYTLTHASIHIKELQKRLNILDDEDKVVAQTKEQIVDIFGDDDGGSDE